MINIPPRKGGQLDDLTERRDLAQIPLGAGEEPLCILPGSAGEREAVHLHQHTPAQQGVCQPLPEIDEGQGHGLLALTVIHAQGLHRPARDGEIARPAIAREREGGAQPIIPADVIAAQEGAVCRDAARC